MTINETLNSFDLTLTQIIKLHAGIYTQAEQIILLCRETLKELQHLILLEPFESPSLEIDFFKIQKQVPLVNLVYYSSVLDFENQFPRTGIKFQDGYVKEYLKHINRFYFKHKDFIDYIRSEHINLDELYFTRKHFLSQRDANYDLFYRDEAFCTLKDLTLAQYYAYERLVGYIHNSYDNAKLMHKSRGLKDPLTPLQWTCSKTDLTELIYAIHSASAINNGNIEIKEIAKTFEIALHFELDDFYKTYAEIKRRKKSRTKFLDNLSFSLIHQIDKSEK